MERISNIKIFEEIYKNEKIYIIIENGWYYSYPVGAYKTKEECLSVLNETENSLYEKQNMPHSGEGFWYYSIEETTIKDLILKIVNEETQKKVYDVKEEIVKNGNKEIYYNGYRAGKEEAKQLLRGIEYLIVKNNFGVYSDFDTNKQAFEKLDK